MKTKRLHETPAPTTRAQRNHFLALGVNLAAVGLALWLRGLLKNYGVRAWPRRRSPAWQHTHCNEHVGGRVSQAPYSVHAIKLQYILVVAIAATLPLSGVAAPTSGAGATTSASTVPAGAASTVSVTTSAVATSGVAKPIATLAPITVSAANTEPHIWAFQKGTSRILVLGTVAAEPKGLDFIPFSIDHAISESGAVIGPPGFDFGVHVNIFHILSIWHASNSVTYLPDDKQLADVLPPATLQQWNTLKARYLPGNHKVDGMRPMYAGWKLYDAALDDSGVAWMRSVPKLIQRAAHKRGIKVTDAQFHWIVKDPMQAAHAFTPSPEADLGCFQTILGGIQGLPDLARALANDWARGNVTGMRAFLANHSLTPPCWVELTDETLAKQQGLDLAQRERDAWLAAVNTAAAKSPVIFTTAPVEQILDSTGRIRWLLDDGYTMAPPSAEPASTSGANATVGRQSGPSR